MKQIGGTPLLSSLWMMLQFLIFGADLFACDIDQHHSILGHYNESDDVLIVQVHYQRSINQVIEGSYIIDHKIGVTVQKQLKKNPYLSTLLNKNCARTRLMSSSSTQTNWQKGKRYLLFTKALSTSKKRSNRFVFYTIEDSTKIEEVSAFLDSVRLINQKVVEYTQYGRIWSEGVMLNGLADGLWHYYGQSGELQASGAYNRGRKVGKWHYYHSISDRSYEQILYFIDDLRTDSSSSLIIDTNDVKPYRFVLMYRQNGREMMDSFFYNNKPIRRTINYQNNVPDGMDIQFDERGDTLDYFTYQKGVLDGPFYAVKPMYEHSGSVRIKGSYCEGVKIREEHFFMDENQKVYARRTVVLDGKKSQ